MAAEHPGGGLEHDDTTSASRAAPRRSARLARRLWRASSTAPITSAMTTAASQRSMQHAARTVDRASGSIARAPGPRADDVASTSTRPRYAAASIADAEIRRDRGADPPTRRACRRSRVGVHSGVDRRERRHRSSRRPRTARSHAAVAPAPVADRAAAARSGTPCSRPCVSSMTSVMPVTRQRRVGRRHRDRRRDGIEHRAGSSGTRRAAPAPSDCRLQGVPAVRRLIGLDDPAQEVGRR